MSLFLNASFPDIRDIMLRGDYSRFPSFIDVDKQLEWIESFAPYRDPRLYIRNHFDELADIPAEVAKRLYRKIEGVLGLLQQDKEGALSRIHREYETLYTTYLEKENLEYGFRTLFQLADEYDIEIVYPEAGEMTLYEKQYNLVIVPFRKDFYLIKRTFLEIFWDEGENANPDYLSPVREFLLQEIVDIPIDVQRFEQRPAEISTQLLLLYEPIGSTSDTTEHSSPSSQ